MNTRYLLARASMARTGFGQVRALSNSIHYQSVFLDFFKFIFVYFKL